MTIKRAVDFSVSVIGDGLTSVISVPLATAQVFVAPPPELSAGYKVNSTLDLNANKPTDVMCVYSPTGGVPPIVNSAIATLGTELQVTFEAPPLLNAPVTIAGKFVF